MTKLQIHELKAGSAARIQEMKNELGWLALQRCELSKFILKINDRHNILAANITAEQNSVKDL